MESRQLHSCNLLQTVKPLAKAAIIIIFLALIRCIGEFFRLQYEWKDALTIQQIKPFEIGAMLCAFASLAMVILFFYSQYRFVITIAALTIAGMFLIKAIYL